MARMTLEEKRALRYLRSAGLVSQMAAQVSPQPKVSPFRPKVQGKGWPCSAVPPCSRSDLGTAARAAVHATDRDDLVTHGHLSR